MDPIFSRRSIRKYTSEAISDRQLRRLLESGMSAPSSGNERPWAFIVLNDRKLLDRIPFIHPYSSMVRTAPLAILVCGDQNKVKCKEFILQDCAAAVENILIETVQNNLGAVWVGIFPDNQRMEAFRQLLNIPQDILPFALIPIGYPDEVKEPVSRFEENLIHYNGW